MNLYIIRGVLRDYSSGMVCIKCETVEETRKHFHDWLQPNAPYVDEEDPWGHELMTDFDNAIRENKYIVVKVDSDDSNPIGVIANVWGGG
jgi:hypothetical protein